MRAQQQTHEGENSGQIRIYLAFAKTGLAILYLLTYKRVAFL